MYMHPKAQELLNKANEAKALFGAGDISYDELHTACKAYVDFANKRVKAIAKEHGMRPKLISVKAFMR